MDAETEAAIGALRERLDQIDARLERGATCCSTGSTPNWTP
jgi:hypothetical protein